MLHKRKVALAIFLIILTLIIQGDLFLQLVLQGKWSAPFYRGNKLPDQYLDGDIRLLEKGALDADETLSWKKFSMAQHQLSLPYQHPDYRISFRLDIGEEGKVLMGVNFFNKNNWPLVTLRLLAVKSWRGLARKQPIFTLPTSKELIQEWNLTAIFQDLFVEDISIPLFYHWDFKVLLKKFYLAEIRSGLFPPDGKALLFFPLSRIGLIPRMKNKAGDQVESLYVPGHGNLSVFELTYKSDEREALIIRYQILKHLVYQKSDQKMAQVILKEFQSLPFAHKVSEVGMIYLMSAWSHYRENKELLRQAISFLERGKGKLVQLGPLYRFALEQYGTDFSSLSSPEASGNQEFQKKEEKGPGPKGPSASTEEQVMEKKLKDAQKKREAEPDTLYWD